MQFLNQPLRTEAAPAGIVSFELAGTIQKTQTIVTTWNIHAGRVASFSLGFDNAGKPALSLYALLCLNHCHWCSSVGGQARRQICHRWRLVSLGSMRGCPVRFDALENFALWVSLTGPVLAPWPQVAFWCASLKFALILPGLGYALIGWLLPKR